MSEVLISSSPGLTVWAASEGRKGMVLAALAQAGSSLKEGWQGNFRHLKKPGNKTTTIKNTRIGQSRLKKKVIWYVAD